jgi:hypothetical protein
MSGEDLFRRIVSLEERVSVLEAELAHSKPLKSDKVESEQTNNSLEIDLSGSTLESRFGEFGLAWLGNLVLLFGIIFFIIYLQNKGLGIVSTIIGYSAVTGLFMVSNFLKDSHKNMASIFSLNGYILLYIVTMQLHFISKNPVISGLYPVLVMLILVSAVQGYMAVRRKSEGLAGLAFIMAAVTAILSDQTHFLLPLAFVISIAAVYFFNRFGWWRLVIFSIFLVYFVNLLWLIGNPVMDHPLQVLKEHGSGFIYLFLIAASYSSIAMIRQKGLFPDYGAVSSIIINGLGFSFLVSLFVLAFFRDNYILLFGSIALFCLLYSIFLQFRGYNSFISVHCGSRAGGDCIQDYGIPVPGNHLYSTFALLHEKEEAEN